VRLAAEENEIGIGSLSLSARVLGKRAA